ncbi:Bacterial transcription activator, effector binding domain [compost metagenome]
MYALEQMETLSKIIFLRDIGCTVSEIAVALAEWDSDVIVQHLKSKQHEIHTTIKQEQNKLQKIKDALESISNEKPIVHQPILMKAIPSYSVISLRRKINTYYSEGELWQELFEFIQSENIQLSSNYENLTIYHDSEYEEHDVDIEVCMAVKEHGVNREPFMFKTIEAVPLMASTMVYGEYDNILGAYQSFAKWLTDHSQYRMTGQSRQIVHRGAWNESDPDKYLTEIQILLT